MIPGVRPWVQFLILPNKKCSYLEMDSVMKCISYVGLWIEFQQSYMRRLSLPCSAHAMCLNTIFHPLSHGTNVLLCTSLRFNLLFTRKHIISVSQCLTISYCWNKILETGKFIINRSLLCSSSRSWVVQDLW
jgi:hypothetical protein